MVNVFLRVKIKSLTVESKMIRREERRQLRQARWLRRAERVNEVANCEQTYNRLRDHRKFVVGKESRLSVLAYGYLKGMAFRQMEPNAERQPSWSGIRSVLSRFVVLLGSQKESYNAWEAEAIASFEPTAVAARLAAKQARDAENKSEREALRAAAKHQSIMKEQAKLDNLATIERLGLTRREK